MPGVDSPARLESYWSTWARPRLDALQRVAGGLGATTTLLPALDQLLHELKQVSTPARHCAARHADPAWRAAAERVAASCDKYEEFILRSRGLYSKLCGVHRQVADATDGLSDRYSRGANPAQLTRLAAVLRAVFERGGVRVDDGLSHLLAPYAAPGLDDALTSLTDLQRRERAVARRVAAVVSDVRVAPVLHLASDVDWGPGAIEDAEGADPDRDASRLPLPPPPWQGDELIASLVRRTPQLSTAAVAEAEAPKGSDGSDWESDEGAPGAARWEDAVVLDRVATQALLTRHPNPGVRHAVYGEGVVRRMNVITQLCSQQAAARARTAALHGRPSFADVMQSPGSMAVGGPAAVLDVLKRLADATGKPARTQVVAMSMLTGWGSEPPPPHSLAHAQRALRAAAGLDVPYDALAPYMRLTCIVEGLGQVLSRSLGIQLQVVHAPPNHGSIPPHPSSETGLQFSRPELWSPDQVVVHVLTDVSGGKNGSDEQAAPPIRVGVMHLDPGGGYGTRQLRFGRAWDSQPLAVGQSPPAEALPVVAVGLQHAWHGGAAGAPAALWELLHETGHALHLLLSSRADRCLFKHAAGLHLPLDLLEVPSMLFEQLAMHSSTLRAICLSEAGAPMPSPLAARLASQVRASHYSALDFQDQVLVALADQVVAMTAGGSSARPDAAAALALVCERWSAVPHAPATLKRLAALPVAAHHPGLFWCYPVCFVVAALLWQRFLGDNPLGPSAGWRLLRASVLEVGADQDPQHLLASWLGEEVPAGGCIQPAWPQPESLEQLLGCWLWTGPTRPDDV